MAGFRDHRGWCPRALPPDPTVRLDVFPEYGDGDLLPVWRRGVGVHPYISEDLADALRAWNVSWEHRHAVGASVEDPGWRDPWRQRGEELAIRLGAETGCQVVLLWPLFDGRDESRENCRTLPWEV